MGSPSVVRGEFGTSNFSWSTRGHRDSLDGGIVVGSTWGKRQPNGVPPSPGRSPAGDYEGGEASLGRGAPGVLGGPLVAQERVESQPVGA